MTGQGRKEQEKSYNTCLINLFKINLPKSNGQYNKKTEKMKHSLNFSIKRVVRRNPPEETKKIFLTDQASKHLVFQNSKVLLYSIKRLNFDFYEI